MVIASSNTSPAKIPSSAIFAVVGLAILNTWGLVGFAIFLPEIAKATFGEVSGSNPVDVLATWSPAISAFLSEHVTWH